MPTIAELYLAFRQAKLTLWSEHRGIRGDDIARYEKGLHANLQRLRQHFSSPRRWFDDLDIGQLWAIPKKHREKVTGHNGTISVSAPEVVYIGVEEPDDIPSDLDIRLELSPSLDFHIAEVLFLWKFGHVLESVLKPETVGYRLRKCPNAGLRTDRWLFNFWPQSYREFRTQPLNEARRLLKEEPNGACWITSLDLASFYDNIDPSFITSEPFVQELQQGSVKQEISFDTAEYLTLSLSLVRSYDRYHALIKSLLGIETIRGIPVGSLCGRVIANVALSNLDQFIVSQPDVACYRRYVDDIIIVGDPSKSPPSTQRRISQVLPISLNRKAEELLLDENFLGRPGSRFEIQQKKTKEFELAGPAGLDYLKAVSADLNRVASERRMFVDPQVIRKIERLSLVTTTGGKSSRLRVLRDADRSRLEQFSIAVTLRTLDRAIHLLKRDQAMAIFKWAVQPVLHLLDDKHSWIENLRIVFRILELGVLVEDEDTVARLLHKLDSLWETCFAGSSSVSLYWAGHLIRSKRAHVRVRNYLHEHRIEAICSAFPLFKSRKDSPRWAQAGIRYGTRRIKSVFLRARASLLARVDLRRRDREEDEYALPLYSHAELTSALKRTPSLASQFSIIDSFVKQCVSSNVTVWHGAPSSMFLMTRPPSYFDVSRVLLRKCDFTKLPLDAFDQIQRAVNALRGTRYSRPVGSVLPHRIVQLESSNAGNPQGNTPDPRLILGNLTLREKWHDAVLSGTPDLNAERLAQLAELLERADHVTRYDRQAFISKEIRQSLLVLPELAIPRAWLRTLANAVISNGTFSLVTGLEYLRHPSKPLIFNEVIGVFPRPFRATATWLWMKRRPARHEQSILDGKGLKFLQTSRRHSRVVIRTDHGALSVLICSEILEARLVSELLTRAEVVLMPSWNQDTASYDHLIKTAGLQLHAILAIANNGEFSDCRIWAPHAERWRQDISRLVLRKSNDVVFADLPLNSLRNFHESGGAVEEENQPPQKKGPCWKPLPPDYD